MECHNVGKIKEIIYEKLSEDEVKITEKYSFKDDLGVDFLELCELVAAFEEEHEIAISFENLTQITTVRDIVDYIKNKGAET